MAARSYRADHLTNDEVDYELMIRGHKESTKDELSDKHRLLRRLFSEDAKENKTYKFNQTMDEQYEHIGTKVDYLVKKLEKGHDDMCISRLKHYLMRTERCVVQDERSKKLRNDLISEINGYLLQYDRQVEGVAGGGDSGNNKKGVLPKSSSNSDKKLEEVQETEDSQRTEETYKTEDYQKMRDEIVRLEQQLEYLLERERQREQYGGRNSRRGSERRSSSRERNRVAGESEIITADRRMEKWHISFNGDTRQRSLEDFLHKVNKLARMDHIGDDMLLQRIHTILRGEAYDWFLCYSDEFRDWKHFEERIRYMYGNPNRDQGNRQKIYERKQQRNETFLSFKMDVERLNKQLSSPLEQGRLFEIIWDNMRPHYRSKLACRTVPDLSVLEYYAYRIDANDPALRQHREGPSRAINPVHNIEVKAESDDSYSAGSETEEVNEIKQKYDKNRQPKEGGRSQPEQQQRRTTENTEGRTIPLCWNCNKNGHLWRHCQEPKRIFCYACGNRGKTTVSCPNHVRDSQQSGRGSGN